MADIVQNEVARFYGSQCSNGSRCSSSSSSL